MIKCVIFDIGDTLIDMRGAIKEIWRNVPEREVLKKHGFDFTKEELFNAKKEMDRLSNLEKSNYLTTQKEPLFFSRILMKVLNLEENDLIAKELEDIFYKSKEDIAKPIKNSKELLKQLHKKGIILGIISNTKNETNMNLIKKFDLDKYFYIILESHKEGHVKSEGKIFVQFLELLNKNRSEKISFEECLMVGNNICEDTIAKKVGMKTVILKPFLCKRENIEFVEPDYYINDLIEVLKLVG